MTAKVLQFPERTEREWRWVEDELRKCWRGTLFDGDVIESALVALEAHWEALFGEAPVDVPGPFSDAQIDAMGRADALLKKARLDGFHRLTKAELVLAYYRVHGTEPDAA